MARLALRLERAGRRRPRAAIKLVRSDAVLIQREVEAAVVRREALPSPALRFAGAVRAASAPRGRPRRTVEQIEARLKAIGEGVITVGDDRDTRRDAARARWLRWVEAELRGGRTLLTMLAMPRRK